MDLLQQLLSELSRQQAELRARVNKALEGVGPLEQHEVAQPVAFALREMDWAKERIAEIGESIDAKVGNVDDFLANLKATVQKEGLAAAVAEGTVLKKEDHDTQITAAKKEAKNEAETEFKAERAKEVRADERRAELVEEIGQFAASKISKSDLMADDAEDRITKFKARASTLKASGFNEKEHDKAMASLLACSLDKDGQTEFDARVESFKPFLAAAPPKKQEPGKQEPGTEFQATGHGAGEGGDEGGTGDEAKPPMF